MEEVKIALAAIKKSTYTPSDSPLLELRYSDVKPNFKRQKSYDMVTKINAFATGVSHGLAPQHMIPAINLFDDVQQVIADSKPYMDRYLASIYDKQNTNNIEKKDRIQGDLSDQRTNSPLIEGMDTKTNNAETFG